MTPTYCKLIEEDLKEVWCATKPEKTDLGTFQLVQGDSSIMYIYVYTYAKQSQVINSSIGMDVWDSLGAIVEEVTTVQRSEIVLDLLPFFRDNLSLAEERSDDTLMQKFVCNRMQADDSGKYMWQVSHKGLDWDEDVWVKRLYFCLREAEKELGVAVIDVSQDGQKWERRPRRCFFNHSYAQTVHPLKG